MVAGSSNGSLVSNSQTITLAGAFTTSGANPLTLTTTGSTNVTLPTSGTLATTAGIPSLPLSVSNGGTGVGTLTGVLTGNGTGNVTANAVTQHGVLIAGASNAVSNLGVAATGTVLAGSTGADPAFTATPTVTSITFGAGTALSNYAEGTWTPGISFGGGTTGITYTTQNGIYVRVGKLCFISFVVTLSSKGSSTGVAKITGLPFTSQNVANPGTFFVENLAFTLSATNTNVFCVVDANATTIGVNQQSQVAATPSGASNASDTNFANTTLIQGSVCFYCQ